MRECVCVCVPMSEMHFGLRLILTRCSGCDGVLSVEQVYFIFLGTNIEATMQQHFDITLGKVRYLHHIVIAQVLMQSNRCCCMQSTLVDWYCNTLSGCVDGDLYSSIDIDL
jgi:hypothetical protein